MKILHVQLRQDFAAESFAQGFRIDCSNIIEFVYFRFGLIMSIVATRDIVAGEEVLVSYNYDIPHAPVWYRDQWFEYLRSSVGWSEERIEKWCGSTEKM